MNPPIFPSRLVAVLSIAATGIFTLPASLQAQPLNYTTGLGPDIYTTSMEVGYTASTGTLKITGSPSTIRFNDTGGSGFQYFLRNGLDDPVPRFELTASINNLGVLQPGGTLKIFGDLDLGQTPSGGGPVTPLVWNNDDLNPLLSATLTKWGYDNDPLGGYSQKFEFEFLVNPSSPLFPFYQAQQGAYHGGLIVTRGTDISSDSSNTSFAGSFTTNWGLLSPQAITDGTADAFPIPEPSAYAGLLALLAASVASARRWRNARSAAA